MATTQPPYTASVSDTIRGQIVQTATGKFVAPHNIIQTVNGARALYYRYRTEHLRRIQLYAQIEGLIAGNPPYDPLELERNGLGHIANFNSGDGSAFYEKGANAYFNLINEAERLVTFQLRGDDPSLIKYANIMAEHWNDIVRAWPGFLTQINTLSGQLVKFGISPLIWPDERDWRWRTIELSRFFVADQCLSDIDQLTAVFVETSFTAQYLWELYDEFKDKRDKTSWDLDELGSLLVYKANTYAKNNFEIIDMMDLQRRLQNRDLTYDCIFSDNLRIISLLYKEYEGGVSHYMFDRTFDKGNFLYRADRQYNTMPEAINIFTASPGEFTIHSNRGLGHRVFSPCQATMQLECSVVDGARWSTTPLIRSTNTGGKEFEPIKFTPGVPTHIGTAEFMQNNMGANLEQLIGVSNFVTGKLERNLANSGNDPSMPDADQGSLSAPEARFRSFKEFSVLKNKVMHFYAQLDPTFLQMTIKMLSSKEGWPGHAEASEWKERCIQDGVPPIIFKGGTATKLPPAIKSVRATRVAGDGSTAAQILGLQELAPDVGAFGAKGQREYLRLKIRASLGNEYTNAFMPPETPDEVSGGASLAAVENAVMRAGESPVFSLDNMQDAHIITHIALGTDTIQKIQQQVITPVDADKVFSVLIPHNQQHMEAIANNPYQQGFLLKVKKPWEQIVQYATLNRKNAGEMLRAELKKKQDAAQDLTAEQMEQQRKDLVAQKDVERSDKKVDSQIARAKEASDTRASIQRDKVRMDADNKRLAISLEAQNKNIETESEQELRTDIQSMNGATPAPNDIEPIA